MTAVKPVLDVFLDLNLVMALSALVWLGARAAMAAPRLRNNYMVQLRALKALLVCAWLSPVLALGVPVLVAQVMPGQPVSIGDIAVAAYLRGDIAMPATQFEALLNARQHWVELLLTGQNPLLLALAATLTLVAIRILVRMVRDATTIRRTVVDSFLWRRSPRVDIRLSDRITVPFAVRGLRRRHVVLPSHLLDTPRELRFALAHELEHVRARDVEWELGFEILRPLLFWNPAYWVLKHQFNRLRELACDQSVVTRRGIDAADYVNCLLDYCARTVTRGQPRVLNVALVPGGKAKRALRQRVMALADVQTTHPSLPAVLLGTTFLFAFLLAVGAASIRQTQDWSHDRLMLSTVVNLERLEARNRGN